MGKKTNSDECIAGGYKLSCLVTEIGCSENVQQVSIGCDDDDTFYDGAGKSGRVEIEIEMTDGQLASIDLEDVLRFARSYCNGIYERVLMEMTTNSVDHAPRHPPEGD